MRRSIRARLLASTLAVLAALVALELAARVLYPPPEFIGRLPFDRELGFRGRADHRLTNGDAAGTYDWVLNEHGFRGPPLPGPRAEGDEERRVLFVGDSFLVGWDVREESLMPFSAERRLAQLGLPARCFDASCDGYGTAQELLLLRDVAPRVEPDVVVLALYPGNDVIDNTIELVGRTRISSGAYVRPYLVPDGSGGFERRWVNPRRAFFRRNSHLFALIEHRMLLWTRDSLRFLAPTPDEHPVALDERLRLRLVPRASLELLREHGDEGEDDGADDVWEVAWIRTEALLRAFRDEVRSLGARLLVVVIPRQLQVQNDASLRQLEFDTLRSGGASLHERLDWNLPERRLAAFFEAEGMHAVLLLEPLREVLAREGESVYLHNGHLNGRGHELAGDLAARAIADMLAGPPTIEPPPLQVPTGAPVDAIRRKLTDGIIHVDFQEDRHPEFLDGGWKEWRVAWGDGGPGWAMGGNGGLALPYRGGRFVLSGWLPRTAQLPTEIVVSIGATRLGAVLVEQPGPFELSFEAPAFNGPVKEPIVLIRIWAGRKFHLEGAGPCGLILHAIGFTES
ncbi:MAG: hypothetical protein O7B99_08300 [Planctomycetota bacterium]|nr:hypothetical protein [Planctomycetota bacterium]